MYRKIPKNPKVEELTKTYTGRSYNLSDLKVIKIEENHKLLRYCVWCAEGKLRHGSQKYCSKDCNESAMAWAYPQREYGLYLLLEKQEWKCAGCQFDWKTYADQIRAASKAPLEIFVLAKRLKYLVPYDKSPEVDHVTPIFKGGQSLGLGNHQALCYTCHKVKTGADIKGRKIAKSTKPKCVVCNKRNATYGNQCKKCCYAKWGL